MSNLLKAIKNVINSHGLSIEDVSTSNNRANAMGESLELYIKKSFAGITNYKEQKEDLDKIFSYQGNTRNPPDAMLKNGDAIEIKKIESYSGDLQLNSSHPKRKLFSNDIRISNSCRNCEEWTSKDHLYIVGHVDKQTKSLKSLWFFYGECFANDDDFYESIENKIKKKLLEIEELNDNATTELGRFNNIDSLNVSSLRVRGMWILSHPKKIFGDLYDFDQNSGKDFQLYAIMTKSKFDSFPKLDRTALLDCEGIEIIETDIQVADTLTKSILLTYSI